MDISPLARAVIKRGTILHSDEFDYVDHGKMFVVMGEDDTQLYGFFFINSDINPKNLERRESIEYANATQEEQLS